MSHQNELSKLLGERKDEGYKENTGTFWNVLLSKKKFQFLTF